MQGHGLAQIVFCHRGHRDHRGYMKSDYNLKIYSNHSVNSVLSVALISFICVNLRHLRMNQ